MRLPRRPTADSPINLQWAWDVADAIRAMQLSAGQGLRIQSGPSGIMLSASPAPKTFSASGYPEPWDFTLDGAAVTFENCVYMRGPVTAVAAPPEYTVTGANGDVWLSAKIDTETGACEIIEGASLALAADASVPADKYVKVPLLKLIKTTSGETVSLSVALDLRRMMCLILYV